MLEVEVHRYGWDRGGDEHAGQDRNQDKNQRQQLLDQHASQVLVLSFADGKLHEFRFELLLFKLLHPIRQRLQPAFAIDAGEGGFAFGE